MVCPVAAITERSEWREVEDLLDSKRKAGCTGVAGAGWLVSRQGPPLSMQLAFSLLLAAPLACSVATQLAPPFTPQPAQ